MMIPEDIEDLARAREQPTFFTKDVITLLRNILTASPGYSVPGSASQ